LTLAAFPLIPRLLRERSADRGVIKRLEALATWTELLRDTLHAAAGIEGAITATAPLAPLAVRPHVERIAGRLRRMDPGDSLATALRDFADAMDHYVADTVVLSLIAATERQGGRLTEQLDAAARDARDLVTFYRETETERVEVRATVRIVMAVTVGWALLLTLVSPGYFSFYGTPVGQLVLLFGPGCLFGLSIGWQVRLSRLPRQPRLLMPLQPGKLTPEHHHHLIPLDGHVGISA
jgi:Flp pilus assembly protein TadB